MPTKKISDVEFPRIITTNARLKKLKREAQKRGISVKALAEEILKNAEEKA
jgi:hypothetical protein